MTKPVLNTAAAFGVVRSGMVFLLQPWNSFFQQFTQKPTNTEQLSTAQITASPFFYTPNNVGTVFVIGGTVSAVALIRGTNVFDMTAVRAYGILVSIGDTVKVTYSVKPNIYFNEL